MIFKVPNIGDDFSEAKVVSWFVKEGDVVKKDDEIVELITDKASFVLPSPVDGKVVKIYKREGDVLGGDMVLAEIMEEKNDA